MNAQGAHFIEEDIALFDASFFSFSTDIAKASTAITRVIS